MRSTWLTLITTIRSIVSAASSTKTRFFIIRSGSTRSSTAIANDEHRRRRAPLNHFFSRRAVFDLEDIIQEKVKKLCRRIQQSLDVSKPVDLQAGTRAVSIDIITEYAFDDCWNHLDVDDFAAWFSEAARDGGVMWWTFQQFPVLLKPMQAIPEDYARKMSPTMNGWIGCVVRSREYVMRVDEQFKAGSKPSRRTIFHELLDPSSTDEKTSTTPSIKRLYGEALSFCTAAADTTGNAMDTAAYHVVTNPDIYEKLKKELREAFPDPSIDLEYTTLEKLPYLTGVVKEGQRLSCGVIGRLARATPDGGATFNGYFVPAGVCLPLLLSW
jgi:cytochrome P450